MKPSRTPDPRPQTPDPAFKVLKLRLELPAEDHDAITWSQMHIPGFRVAVRKLLEQTARDAARAALRGVLADGHQSGKMPARPECPANLALWSTTAPKTAKQLDAEHAEKRKYKLD